MKSIAIIPTIRKETDIECLCDVILKLKNRDAEIRIDKSYESLPVNSDVIFADEEEVYGCSELIIALGGDGSILRAAEFALRYNIPLLGINLGRLGYMAALEKNELDLIDRIFDNSYMVDKRMTLSVEIGKNDGSVVHIGDVLNDVVIGRGDYVHTIDMELVANGRQVRTIRSDGLILATPTGSTAYSMAAGGSVIDPALDCICVTPICPISRYACPLVFAGESVIEIYHADDRGEAWSIVLDGDAVKSLDIGDKLIVKRSEKFVRMLSVKKEGFFEKLNSKISKYELKS